MPPPPTRRSTCAPAKRPKSQPAWSTLRGPSNSVAMTTERTKEQRSERMDERANERANSGRGSGNHHISTTVPAAAAAAAREPFGQPHTDSDVRASGSARPSGAAAHSACASFEMSSADGRAQCQAFSITFASAPACGRVSVLCASASVRACACECVCVCVCVCARARTFRGAVTAQTV